MILRRAGLRRIALLHVCAREKKGLIRLDLTGVMPTRPVLVQRCSGAQLSYPFPYTSALQSLLTRLLDFEQNFAWPWIQGWQALCRKTYYLTSNALRRRLTVGTKSYGLAGAMPGCFNITFPGPLSTCTAGMNTTYVVFVVIHIIDEDWNGSRRY